MIYDLLGNYINTLISNYYMTGEYSVVWDSKNNGGLEVAAGMYIYKMISGDFVKVNKMLLIK